MIEREAAMPLLQPLASPTIEAFAQAQGVVAKLRAAAKSDIDGLEPGVAASFHGVNFWAFFSAKLQAAFSGVAERDLTTSDQRHCWLAAEGTICVYLKSNVDELCFEQRMLDHFPPMGSIEPALVALTWEHQGADRLHPSFIHLDEGRPVWELPARELAASNVEAIRTAAPRPDLGIKPKLRRPSEAKRDAKAN